MRADELTAALGGRWHGRYGTAHCPTHDDHEPSLSIRDGAGGEPMVHCFAGCDWRDIKNALRTKGLVPERVGHAPQSRRRPNTPKPRPDNNDQQQRIEFAGRKWREAVAITGSPAEIYLHERGLKPGPDGWPLSLRYHPALKHTPTGLFLPALIAAITVWPSRTVVGVQRTYLVADGRKKAPVVTPRMTLGRCGGGAVRLTAAGPELILTEGIEDGLAILTATGLPVWAALGTSGLRSVILPVETHTITIAADADEPGEQAAQDAARRFVAEGRTAKIARPPPGMDFNDLAMLPENVTVLEPRREARHG